MKKGLWFLVACLFTLSLFISPTTADAAKREKFGTDARHLAVSA